MKLMDQSKQWERLQLNSHLLIPRMDAKRLSEWKLSLQHVVNMTIKDYVSLEEQRRTGLQLLALFGEHYHTYMTPEQSERSLYALPGLIQQFLKSFCHVMWHPSQENVLHAYVVDETIPAAGKLYAGYMQGQEIQVQPYDKVVLHFLLEDKTVILKQRGIKE